MGENNEIASSQLIQFVANPRIHEWDEVTHFTERILRSIDLNSPLPFDGVHHFSPVVAWSSVTINGHALRNDVGEVCCSRLAADSINPDPSHLPRSP